MARTFKALRQRSAFFLPVKGAPDHVQDAAVLIARLRSRVEKRCCPVLILPPMQEKVDAACCAYATQVLTLPYLTAFQFVRRVCLVFFGELKDPDAFANKPMPFRNERAS